MNDGRIERRHNWALFAMLVATAGTGLAELPWLTEMSRHGGGLFDFELVRTAHRAEHLLSAWGSPGQRAARLSSWFDFAFILSYAGLFLAAAKVAAAHASVVGDNHFRRLPAALRVVGLAAATTNAVDKSALLLILYGRGDNAAPSIAFVASIATYVLLALGICLLGWLGLSLLRTRIDPTARVIRSVQVEV